MKRSGFGTWALGLITVFGCTEPTATPPEKGHGDNPFDDPSIDVGPAGEDVTPEPACVNRFSRVDLSSSAALMNARALIEIGGALRIVATSGLTGSYDHTGTLIADNSYDLGAGLTSVVSVEGGAFHMHGACDCGPAKLIFSTEGGRLIAVNPDLGGRDGVIVVDRSDVGADYKGVAVLDTVTGPLLLAADFFNDRLDVFDTDYQLVDMGPNAFVGSGFPDPTLGMTNVAVLDGNVYITYATKDATGHQPLVIPGGGLVAMFRSSGEVRGQMGCTCLSRPFGLAMAPAGYVASGKRLLVANTGYAGIVGLDPELMDGTIVDFVTRSGGDLLEIEGLTGINFGAGTDAGTLFFTASPDSGTPSTFGRIEATCE